MRHPITFSLLLITTLVHAQEFDQRRAKRMARPPLRWHATYTTFSLLDPASTQFTGHVLPNEELESMAAFHADVLHRIGKRWEVGVGFVQHAQRASGFRERSQEAHTYSLWFFGISWDEYTVTGDAFGLEQQLWMAGPMVAYDPMAPGPRRRVHGTVKFVGGLWFAHLHEAQVIVPDHSYNYTVLLDQYDASMYTPPYPDGQPATGTDHRNTVVAQFGVRAELFIGRYFSFTYDAGAYLGPDMRVTRCTTASDHDQLVIPAHHVSLNRFVLGTGLALHF